MKGSGMFCAVASCHNCRKRALESDRPISFHRFPKNPELRQIWVNRCRRPWEFKIDTSFICSDHFEESDFLRDLKAELLGLKEVKRLKEGAVPSLNLPPEAIDVDDPELNVSCNRREQELPQEQQMAVVCEQQVQQDELDLEPKINIADLNDLMLVDNLEDLVGGTLEAGDLLCNSFDNEDHYIILDISNPT